MQIIIHNISKFCTASNSRDHLNVIKSAYFIESEYFIISVEIMFSLIPAEVVAFLQSSLMKFAGTSLFLFCSACKSCRAL